MYLILLLSFLLLPFGYGAGAQVKDSDVLYTPPVPKDNVDNPIYKDAGPDVQGKRGDVDDRDFDSKDEEYNDIDNSDVDVDDKVLPNPKPGPGAP